MAWYWVVAIIYGVIGLILTAVWLGIELYTDSLRRWLRDDVSHWIWWSWIIGVILNVLLWLPLIKSWVIDPFREQAAVIKDLKHRKSMKVY